MLYSFAEHNATTIRILNHGIHCRLSCILSNCWDSEHHRKCDKHLNGSMEDVLLWVTTDTFESLHPTCQYRCKLFVGHEMTPECEGTMVWCDWIYPVCKTMAPFLVLADVWVDDLEKYRYLLPPRRADIFKVSLGFANSGQHGQSPPAVCSHMVCVNVSFLSTNHSKPLTTHQINTGAVHAEVRYFNYEIQEM